MTSPRRAAKPFSHCRRPHTCGRRFGHVLAWLLAAVFALSPSLAPADPLRLKIVGGLSGVSQFTKLERPFWSEELSRLSGGRLQATVYPYDETGFHGQEMLRLMRLGVVPFGTASMSVAANDEPELNAVDLPTANPDMGTLRQTVARYRERIQTILNDRYRVELLGIYTYPAQVLFCSAPFAGFGDVVGRRVRTSSVGQSELVTALGATPVILPFAGVTKAVRDGSVDCVVTAAFSGNEIGLADVTTHVHAAAISWGVTLFGANMDAWQAIPEDLRTVIRSGVAELETRIWNLAEKDTALGLACNTGSPGCDAKRRKGMAAVPASPKDDALRRKLLAQEILPRWIERCGSDCVESWNARLEPLTHVAAHAD